MLGVKSLADMLTGLEDRQPEDWRKAFTIPLYNNTGEFSG